MNTAECSHVGGIHTSDPVALMVSLSNQEPLCDDPTGKHRLVLRQAQDERDVTRLVVNLATS